MIKDFVASVVLPFQLGYLKWLQMKLFLIIIIQLISGTEPRGVTQTSKLFFATLHSLQVIIAETFQRNYYTGV